MRKIVHLAADHNNTTGKAPGRSLAGLLLTGLLMLSLAACGQQEAGDTGANKSSSAAQSQDCQVTVDTQTWDVFLDMANRMAAGQAVPHSELEAYAEMPKVTAWRQSQAPNVPRVLNLANWIEGAWWDELGKTGKKKTNSNRFALGRSYRYSQSHSEHINTLLAEFTDGERACQVRALAEAWVSPQNLPPSLVLNFIPAMPEMRIFEGEVFIDTGVLQAGGGTQTVRQIASLLYRNLESPEGINPMDFAGEEAIATCLQVMMREGVAGWIEQTTQISFDPKHPSLYKVKIIPEDFHHKAQETIASFELQLPAMLADPVVMTARATDFARQLTGNNGFSQTGIAMATVIVNRLGEERLQQVRLSVPDFVAAYQEAALLNPTPLPMPGALGTELYETVPPLSPELFAPLHDLLVRRYPTP